MTNGNGEEQPQGHIVPDGTPPQLAAHVWQPGQSGNPAGRPKAKTFTEWAREILQEHPIDPHTRKPIAMSNLELLTRSVIKAAISGPPGQRGVALAHLLGRIDPMPRGDELRVEGATVQILIVEEPERNYVEARSLGGNGRANGRGETEGQSGEAPLDGEGGEGVGNGDMEGGDDEWVEPKN